jgi:hypothetical protein
MVAAREFELTNVVRVAPITRAKEDSRDGRGLSQMASAGVKMING